MVLIFGNEIDHERLEYASQIALAMSKYAVKHNLKFAFFGFNSGEPDAEQWEEPHTAALLRYAANNNHHVAIAIHEYSFNSNIAHGDGHLVGRFKYLVTACGNLGIDFAQLRVFITEGGHGKRTATTTPEVGMIQSITWLNSMPTIPISSSSPYGRSATIPKWHGEALSSAVRKAFSYAADKGKKYRPDQTHLCPRNGRSKRP